MGKKLVQHRRNENSNNQQLSMYVVTNNRQIEIEDGIRKMLKKIQGYNQSHPKNKNKKKMIEKRQRTL